MKAVILIFLFDIGIVFCYYSLKLNKIYLPLMPNNSNITKNEIEKNITKIETEKNITKNGTENDLTKDELEEFQEYIDLPLNISELNLFNDSYIKTKNIKSELYTIDLYISSYKQYFRLLLSTYDDENIISSIDCNSCNVSNKYNSTLSRIYMNLTDIIEENYFRYRLFIDSCSIPSYSSKNGISAKTNIQIDNLIFKVLESDLTGFLNSDLIDGILSLSYNNNSQIPNKNFIMELYNEGKISSPSF